MKNIKVPKRIGNGLVRIAYLRLIYDSIKKNAFSGLSHIELDGYENDNDRVKFTYGGRKCTLFGVWLPDLSNIAEVPATLPVTVHATLDDHAGLFDITIDVRDFRFKTLDRIAYEVYDYCKSSDDDDYEDAKREYIANEMDAYREFMS